ncbi:galactose oxidase-like domain-containing protein [Variovorax sp. PAMC 28711]|uniref:galactose oxidase-like domain-containing protein n=1 Tax=Variovorax sp. PAMC 28711 TaxID=1795631 RepID=UPI00078D6184|nr:galactose oxidase-like domain-containing protein [Variovorax sp. PAMC 28711]AMM24985.1 galactose oxidase [Variovorax sp. PAMC 28711]
MKAAVLASPQADSKLAATTVSFDWLATGADEYRLTVNASGATVPLYDGKTTDTRVSVATLPVDGSAITVQLQTRVKDAWLDPVSYTFTAAGYTAAQSTAAKQPWSEVIDLPLVPASAANLPDGKILIWSARAPTYFGANEGTATYTSVFDPVAKKATAATTTNPGQEMFCEGLSMLADGAIMVSGGSDAGKTSIYDSTTAKWTQSAMLNVPRAYNASTTMSDGSVFTVGGSWNGGLGGKVGEVWSVTNKTWRTLPGVPSNMPDASNVADPPLNGPDAAGFYRADNHMWLFGQADGWVFQAGPSAAMHWIDTRGAGKIVQAGLRGDDAYAMTGSAVMYDTGKILKAGGAPNHDSGQAFKSAYIVDINAGPPKPATVRKVAPMAYGRTFLNSVVLPNGEVIVVGGQTQPVGFSDAYGVLAAELWNPVTETFVTLPPMQKARNYHSIALLLMDGRVMSGGGGLCGCAGDHPDAEIYTPPYLLAPDGSPAPRPALTDAPARATWGDTIAVKTDRAVARFSLVRMASTTHSVNTDQRRIPVSFTGSAGDYALSIPTDRGMLLTGNYMLFALDAKGVPSVARTISIR